MYCRRLRSPVATGRALALLAAVTFGITAPALKRFEEGVGVFTTAAALYVGAAAVSTFGGASHEAAPRREHAVRLVVCAVLGAVFAPVCLAWGLKGTSAATASLLLNFEAVFTVLLAWTLYREPLGGRVGVAVAAMVGGGVLLAVGSGGAVGARGWAALAVVSASLGWAADSTLMRPLADLDTRRVVLDKSLIGAALSMLLARFSGEGWPPASALVGLTACGALGYGLSLRLYLLAQRRIGAARTGTLFAVAPFVGAVAAWAVGDRGAAWPTLAAGALFGAAVYLQSTESQSERRDGTPEATSS